MKLIKLSQGKQAIVDDEDFEGLNKCGWYANKIDKNYYAVRSYGGKLMHRIIIKAKKGEIIDHINCNSLDNRKSNLRICTNGENISNQKIKAGKFKGVFKNKNSWVAGIRFNGRTLYLGAYKSPIFAALVYNGAARKYHGEFARLNVIPGAE